MTDGRDALAASIVPTTWVGHGGAVVDRDEVHRAAARERDLDEAAAVAGGRVHHDGRRRRRVDVGRRGVRTASRARPSPIWRASW